MRDGYVFYRSFAEALEDLDDKTFRQVVTDMTWYALDGREPEGTGIASAVFKLIKPQIDANNRRYENGRKGGRPKKEESKTVGTSVVRKATRKPLNEAENWFEEFWEEYPRKVAKADAKKRYLSKCKSREMHEKIMFGLAIAKRSWNDPKYIPHPSTWLNQERWNDDPKALIPSDTRIKIDVPDYIIQQESGTLPESEKASQEMIDEIRKWQEAMEE